MIRPNPQLFVWVPSRARRYERWLLRIPLLRAWVRRRIQRRGRYLFLGEISPDEHPIRPHLHLN
jgi:hypothetical protein